MTASPPHNADPNNRLSVNSAGTVSERGDRLSVHSGVSAATRPSVASTDDSDLFPRGTGSSRTSRERLSQVGSMEDAAELASVLAQHAAASHHEDPEVDSGDDSSATDDLEPSAINGTTPAINVRGPGAFSQLPVGIASYEPRRNSQAMFAEKMHTMLILDWDDTIFPTTWVKEDCGMNWRLSVAAQLEEGPRMSLIMSLLDTLSERAAALLHDAASMANILIVTLAKRPWVELSLKNFLPRLAKVVDMHNMKVVYAQEALDKESTARFMADESRTAEEANELWTRTKRDAIAKELQELHELHDASWKNIISIGDSEFERHGTIIAGEDYMRRETVGGALQCLGSTAEGVSADGSVKRLRMKTVKLLESPTVEELTAELTVLRRWLPYMIKQDSGFDLELATTDDNVRLREIDVMLTGEDTNLSWHELAGMV